MKGQRLPRRGPSDSHAQVNAIPTKIPVVGSGTVSLTLATIQLTEWRIKVGELTVVDLSHGEGDAGDRWILLVVEALQPIAHSKLWTAIIPNNVA